MIPLFILISSFTAFIIFGRIKKNIDINFAGRMALGLMLVFTGTSHFYLTRGMMMTLPPYLPLREVAVYLTGMIEIVLALLIMLGVYRKAVSALIICLLIFILPSNIYAA